jgi:protein-tyrosine phosphatase
MSDPTPNPAPTRVLFVCLGNICRSPLAEGVFLHLVREAGLAHRFEVDSAGTGDWHVGEWPDARSIAVARKHGVELPSRARQVTPADLDAFDHVLAMDRENLRDLERMARRGARARTRLLRAHDPVGGDDDVPDPYYGGPSGFDLVYEMVHRSCAALLADLRGESSRESSDGPTAGP